MTDTHDDRLTLRERVLFWTGTSFLALEYLLYIWVVCPLNLDRREYRREEKEKRQGRR